MINRVRYKDIDRNSDWDKAQFRPMWWGLVLLAGLVIILGTVLPQDTRAQGNLAVYLPIITQDYQLTGEVSGVVLNAADAVTPLPNAQVCLNQSTNCVLTDITGAFSLTNIPLGPAELTAAAFGFFDQTETIEVNVHPSASATFYLIPSTTEGVVRIELIWDNRQDLDSHLWLPPTIPIHIYWRFLSDCGFFPYACLDKDDFAFGPETIHIRQQFPGSYVYAVYKFESGNIADASPQVNVYDSNGLVIRFDIPEDGRGRWWHVFNLDGFTGNITAINQVSSDNPAPYDPSTGTIDGQIPSQGIMKR